VGRKKIREFSYDRPREVEIRNDGDMVFVSGRFNLYELVEALLRMRAEEAPGSKAARWLGKLQ